MPSPAAALSERPLEEIVAPLPGSAEDTSALSLRHVPISGNIVIRQANPDEFRLLGDLLVAAFNAGCWVSQGYERNLRTVAQRALRFHVWVAANADGPLGVVFTPRLEHYCGETFTFSALAVHPSARGLHLSEHLVKHAIALARAHGFATVEIHSSPQMSEAHRIYYRLGFVRHLDPETRFMDEYEERLLTFSYRLLDPLPIEEALIVPPSAVPLPAFGPWALPTTDKSLWPEPPEGIVDSTGTYVLTGHKDDGVARCLNILERALASHRIDLREPQGVEAIATLEAQIQTDLWHGVYAVLYSPISGASEAAHRTLIARLDYLDSLIAAGGPFLHGELPRADDILLVAWLLNWDFDFRAAVGYGAATVINFPHLWDFARRTLALVEAGGLVPNDEATSPLGELPPIPALATLGFRSLSAAWLADVPHGGTTVRRRPTGARLTPYIEDLPAAPAEDQVALLQLAATVSEAELGHHGLADAKLVGILRADLYDTAIRLSNGAPSATQLALRRVFQARLNWLDYRLGKQPWLGGETPSAADYVLLPLLRNFDTVARVFPPIDPLLVDYPNLPTYVSNSYSLSNKEK